jgi:hypothetical protein
MRNLNFWPQIQFNIRKLLIIALCTMFSSFRCILTRISELSRTEVIAFWKQRGSTGFSRKLETDLASEQDKNQILNWVTKTIWSEKRYGSWSFHIGVGVGRGKNFSSVLPFWTKSVLNERSSLNSMLTSNGTYLEKVAYIKVIYSFYIFLESIHTPSSDK